MSFLKLMTRGAMLALLMITTAAGALRAAPAAIREPSVNLALAAPPPAPRTAALVKKPSDDDDAPAAKPAPASHITWWPWALIAAGAGAVAALVFIDSGKDPSCPTGRTCK